MAGLLVFTDRRLSVDPKAAPIKLPKNAPGALSRLPVPNDEDKSCLGGGVGRGGIDVSERVEAKVLRLKLLLVLGGLGGVRVGVSSLVAASGPI